MPDAVISRGSDSVSVPLIEEGGALVRGRDIGKPQLSTYAVGSEDPHIEDNLSAGDTWTMAGELHGSSAYSDAQTLAESIIKPRPDGSNPINLDLSALPSHSTYEVGVITEDALTLTYRPGERNRVKVELTVAGVSGTVGGTQTTSTHPSSESGSGITLRRDSNTAVTLTDGLEVTRKVGRSETRLTPRPGTLPKLVALNKPASDVFEISGRLGGANAESNAQTLEENVLRDPLGDSPLTLSFNGGLYSLAAYNVMPIGSQALRTTYSSGQTGEVGVQTLRLRVVSN